MPTFARVHRSEKAKSSWESEPGSNADNMNLSTFEGLSQGLQGASAELRQLFQEQDTAVRQARLARSWNVPTTNQPRCADPVVWAPKGPGPNESTWG